MVITLVSICFDSPRLGHAIKTNCMKLQTVDPELYSILIFFKKHKGLVSPPHFAHAFSRKMFLMF